MSGSRLEPVVQNCEMDFARSLPQVESHAQALMKVFHWHLFEHLHRWTPKTKGSPIGTAFNVS
jgi:hypothetical protein